MARAYHVYLAAFAADADAKWVDNLLSHFAIPGVEFAGPGVPRRISRAAVYHVALVRILTRYARLPTDTAVDIAARLLSAPAEPLALAPGIELRFDNGEFRRQIDARIADGVDTIAPRRRGRPPSTSARP